MDDSNDFAICAYDSSHKVLKSRLAAHQSKCRKKYPNSGFLICEHNSTHHVHKSEMNKHLNQCRVDFGVQNSTRFDNTSSDDGNVKVTTHFLSQNPDPVDGENWETDEEHYNAPLVSKYDAYFKPTPRNCEAILGLGRKGRKNFGYAEKERVQRLQDKKSILDIQYPNARSNFSTIEEQLKELENQASKLPSKKTLLYLEEIKSVYMKKLDNEKYLNIQENRENFERKTVNGKSLKIGVKINPVVSPKRNGKNAIPEMAKTKINRNKVVTLQEKSAKDQRNSNKEMATSREYETCERKKKSFKEGMQLFPSQGKPLISNNLKDESKISKSKDFKIEAKNSFQLSKNSGSEQTRRTKGPKVETKLEEQKVDSLTDLPAINYQWQIVSRRNRKKSLKPSLEPMKRERS